MITENQIKLTKGVVAALLIIFILIAFLFMFFDSKRKSYYAQVAQATAPYRIAVAECAQNLGKFEGCDAGTNNIPAPITQPKGHVNSLTVSSGVITVTPVPATGINTTDDFILTPSISPNGSITWVSSGRAVDAGYAR